MHGLLIYLLHCYFSIIYILLQYLLFELAFICIYSVFILILIKI